MSFTQKNKSAHKLYKSFISNKLTHKKKKRKYRVLYTQNLFMCRKNKIYTQKHLNV